MRTKMQAEKELVVEEQRDWTSLPDDLLALILSKLNLVNDVSQFHAVCKTWQSVSYPKDHLGFGSQWLIEKRSDRSTIKLFHPLACEAYCMDVPDLRGASIRFSKNGWLLMSDGRHKIFFFNPFSKSKIKLPLLPPFAFYGLKGITFTSDPTSDDCTVFGVSECNEIFMISHGEERWKFFHFDPLPLDLSYCNPIFHDGKFYFLSCQGDVGIFDANDIRLTTLPPPKRPAWVCENYLIDFNGELMSVFVARMGCEVQVYRWDQSTGSWQEVDDLGENMLFLSKPTSFAKKSPRDYMKNKIYFPRFHGKYIVFFSVEEGLYRTFGNDFSSLDHNETTEQLESCWIEPTKDHHPKVDWFGYPNSSQQGDGESENVSIYSSGSDYSSYKGLGSGSGSGSDPDVSSNNSDDDSENSSKYSSDTDVSGSCQETVDDWENDSNYSSANDESDPSLGSDHPILNCCL